MKTTQRIVLCATFTCVLCLSIVLPRTVEASAGDLDPTFGSGGKVTTTFPGQGTARAVALQADGKIVAAGDVGTQGGRDFGLARYNIDGSLDTTFGVGGRVTTSLSGTDDVAFALAIQPDGKIVVAGVAATATNIEFSRFALTRYNMDGSLDATFGGGGKVTTDFPGYSGVGAAGVAIQADGKIIAVGQAGPDFALARYNTDGSLDTSFGVGGRVTTSLSESEDAGTAIAIQEDGKIVVAGYSDASPDGPDVALARYNTDGGLDPTFGISGKVTSDLGRIDTAAALAIQADGKLVVAGRSFTRDVVGDDFFVARYDVGGSLDPTFGMGGTVITDSVFQDAWALGIQANGKIVAAGSAFDFADSNQSFATARYNADGSLDACFGVQGRVLTDFSDAGFEVATALAIQADGNIVVAGWASAGTTTVFALARYINGECNDPPDCGRAAANPRVLWPPDHRFMPVEITGVIDPDQDTLAIRISGVTQDEPVDGLGDGNTSPDAIFEGSNVLLRAERAGRGDGRVYRVLFSADDGNSGICASSVKVYVPHDAKKIAIDSGQAYDSTR